MKLDESAGEISITGHDRGWRGTKCEGRGWILISLVWPVDATSRTMSRTNDYICMVRL